MPKTNTNREAAATMRYLGYRPGPKGMCLCNGCGPFHSGWLRRDPLDPHGGDICSGCDNEE